MIPLAEPDITQLEEDKMLDALRSGWVNTTGPYVKKFEQQLAKTTGAPHAVTTANGTSGLFLALKALGIGPGDKVIVPTITFIATVNAVIHVGAEPIFIGCDPWLNINIDNLQQFLENYYTNDIKAIIPVHIFGHPCSMSTILHLAQQYNLKIIEDACEALGSVHKLGACGTLGDAGILSFSFNKMITTGNGGAVLTNNSKLAKKIKYLATQAKDDPINYIHNDVGYNLGLTNIAAAMGVAQLARLDKFLQVKRQNFELYKTYLPSTCKLIDAPPCSQQSNYWFVGIQCEYTAAIANALAKHNIQTRPLWQPNHLQKPFDSYTVFAPDAAIYYWKRVLNLPCSTTLQPEQILAICKIIKEV